MKKILPILIFYFLIIPNLSYSQIIELGKCYGVNREMSGTTWNKEDFQKLSVIYRKFYDVPKYINENWMVQESEPYVTDNEEIKELLRDGYKPYKVYDKYHILAAGFIGMRAGVSRGMGGGGRILRDSR